MKSVEKILEDIKSFLEANYETALNQVYGKHSDGLTPFVVAPEDIKIQFFNLDNINSESAILIKANLQDIDNTGPIPKQDYQISIAHCFFADRNSGLSDLYKHAFRTQRALGNLLSENYSNISNNINFDVSRFSPEEYEEGEGYLIICGAFLNCSLVG